MVSIATLRSNAAGEGVQRKFSAREKIRVYLSPFDNPQNDYLANFRRNLLALNIEVAPAAEVWSGKARRFNDRTQYLFINWFEDQVLQRQRRGRLMACAVFTYKLVAARVQGVRIVWVRHNYRPHYQDVPQWISSSVFGLLTWCSSKIVVHSATLAGEAGYGYLPHPLYEAATQSIATPDDPLLADISRRVAVLGNIRPNKGIDQMLLTWPQEVPLLLAGEPLDQQLAAELQRIIDRRSLDVQAVFRALSRREFDDVLRQVRAIYIPNVDGTMIVSGAFFHAASLGTPVLMRASRFAREMASECSFACEITQPEQIRDWLLRTPPGCRDETIREAEALFGIHQFATKLSEIMRWDVSHPGLSE